MEISPDRGTTDLQDYIAQQTTHLTEFDESLVRRWIKQICLLYTSDAADEL